MSDNILPKWLKVDKKRFNSIKNKVQNAKENNLQARPSGKLIDFTMSNKLIRDSQVTYEEALERIKLRW